jgi:ribonuclease BN (tRNA processing enzyme)
MQDRKESVGCQREVQVSRIKDKLHLGVSRRTFLKGLGASVAAAPLLTGFSGRAQATSSPDTMTALRPINYRTRLVLLGTTGGVGWWPLSDRASSSSALVVGDAIYLIDLGQESTYRLTEAFCTGNFIRSDAKYGGGKIEDGSTTFLENVKALFFTHLHMDHTADYPAFLLIGAGAGLAGIPGDPRGILPLKVFGPCSRGSLEENKTQYAGQVVSTDSATPALQTQTPGTKQMTNIIWQAYSQAINNLTLDCAYRDFTQLVDVKDIGTDIPVPFPIPCVDNNTCPVTPKFRIYPYPFDQSEDENGVSVWATLVDHHQVFPSFAFRFDTPDGSVVFSGDTGRNTNGNLQDLAQDADVLVHEVIDKAWVDQKFGDPKEGDPQYPLYIHMLTSHTAIEDVGAVASSCGVKQLVLNHIVPGNTPLSHLRRAKQNFTGKLIIGKDLMQIGIGRPGKRS